MERLPFIAQGRIDRKTRALRRWTPIGGDEFVAMDTKAPYMGDHTPLVILDAKEPHGFAQSRLCGYGTPAYLPLQVDVITPSTAHS